MNNSPPNHTSLGRSRDVQCLQVNLKKIKPALLNLILDAADKKIHSSEVNIFLLTEPPTVRALNKLLNVPNDIYNVFAERGGRAAIVTKGIDSWHCPQYCAKDIIVCQTKINDKLTYLVSLYLDIKIHEFPLEFIQLIANIGNCDILVASDSNAHSTVWNCPKTDCRGELVEDFLITNNLQCVNVGNRPTFCSGAGRTSIIDITFANYSLATSIYNWKVDSDLHISDHYRISFSINNSSNFRINDASDWNFRKGNWNLFQLQLERNMSKWCNARYWTATSIEEKFNDFLNILTATLTQTIPRKIFKRKYKYPPWWDENLTILRSKCRKLAKNKTPTGRDLYTSLRRVYKKAIITAKREGWLKFTSEIKYPSNISKLIKSFNNSKNNALGLLKNRDGDYCDNPTESLNILLSKFFPGHATLSDMEIHSAVDDGMVWTAVKNS